MIENEENLFLYNNNLKFDSVNRIESENAYQSS